MDTKQPLPLLGGQSAATFMRRHWQKKPLVVRQAIADFHTPLDRSALFALAAQEQVESRLVVSKADDWRMRNGPFTRRMLPVLSQRQWTLLVQGVDLHVPAVHAFMSRFRFVPDARLDDVMVSFATDGGGVGPHVDSYDVFLFQAAGRRHWRIGRQKDLSLVEGMPLKILRHFEPEAEYTLEAGDMLYLPPGYAHDGVAVGECMTWSVGFRAPARDELAGEVLQRLAQEAGEVVGSALYRDAGQPAQDHPGAVPAAMHDFTQAALQRLLQEPHAVERVLGEYLSEPKAQVWFEPAEDAAVDAGARLSPKTRMLYDARHVFINGESFEASGRDAQLMRVLADARELSAQEVARLSSQARALLQEWAEGGWLHGS